VKKLGIGCADKDGLRGRCERKDRERERQKGEKRELKRMFAVGIGVGKESDEPEG
jgi:hypothetical protein